MNSYYIAAGVLLLLISILKINKTEHSSESGNSVMIVLVIGVACILWGLNMTPWTSIPA